MHNSILKKAQKAAPACMEKAKNLNACAGRIVFYQTEEIDCSFENGRLKTTGTKQNLYYRTEFIVNSKKGIAFGNNINDLQNISEKAITLAKVGSTAHFKSYPEPSPVKKIKMHSESTAALKREALIEACIRYSEKLKKYDPDLFIMAAAGRSESEKLIITDSSVNEEICDTSWLLDGYVQKTNNTDMVFAGYYRSWRDLNDYFDVDLISEKTINMLELSKHHSEPKKGSTAAVLTPQIFKLMLYSFFLGINGRNVVKGDSPLKGRLGEEIFSKALTITDNPHIDYSSGACPISNEGVPSRILPLIENGILKNFIYDLDTAGMAGTEPTGHNGCSPYNPVITPGTKSSSEIIKEINNGIYIDGLIGFGQSNIINGDFSCNLGLGFKIENGKFSGRIKNIMVSGNIYDIFKNNIILSSDTEPTIYMPYALVEGISIS
jgi:PmbA protein